MKKRAIFITAAAAVVATGLGLYSFSGGKIALPKKKTSSK